MALREKMNLRLSVWMPIDVVLRVARDPWKRERAMTRKIGSARSRKEGRRVLRTLEEDLKLWPSRSSHGGAG